MVNKDYQSLFTYRNPSFPSRGKSTDVPTPREKNPEQVEVASEAKQTVILSEAKNQASDFSKALSIP